MAHPINETLAYLAGIIDGEGTVGSYSRGGGRASEFQFMMQVVNTHYPTLELLQQHLGGRIRVKNQNGSLGKKSCWIWSITDSAAWDAYYSVEPWLRIKRWRGEPLR